MTASREGSDEARVHLLHSNVSVRVPLPPSEVIDRLGHALARSRAYRDFPEILIERSDRRPVDRRPADG